MKVNRLYFGNNLEWLGERGEFTARVIVNRAATHAGRDSPRQRPRQIFQMEVPLPVRYKDIPLGCGYRIDSLVSGDLIVEIKSDEDFEVAKPFIHLAYRHVGR